MIFLKLQVTCNKILFIFIIIFFRKNKLDSARRFTSSYDPSGRSTETSNQNSNATFRPNENNSNRFVAFGGSGTRLD